MTINALIPLAAGKINIDPSEAIARLGRAIQSNKAEGIASLRRQNSIKLISNVEENRNGR